MSFVLMYFKCLLNDDVILILWNLQESGFALSSLEFQP